MQAIEAKFRPGKVCATPAVMSKVDGNYAMAALLRHLQGDWGLCDSHDWQVNEDALQHGDRLMSVYPLPNESGNFWIITEGTGQDTVTTILLPSDY